MNFKRLMIGSLIGAATLASSPAVFAGFSGNVGATSKYIFRGIAQNGDAAVQGGIDYASDTGLYAGTWVSTIGFGGDDDESSEVDLYGGWSGDMGGIGLDVGALYYYYPEEDEVDAELGTLEFYAGLSFGPLGLTYYYSDENNFFIGDGQGEAAGYILAALELPITDTLAFTATIGHYSGDEIERFLVEEDSYVDYSIGLSKSLEGGMSFGFQIIDTDIDVGGIDDDPEFVVNFGKEFDL